MTNEELKNKVLSIVPEAELFDEGYQFLNVIVSPDKLYSLAKQLKDSEDTRFDFLFCLSGVDWGEYLMVVYHLSSPSLGHTIVLKAKITDRVNPAIDTVCSIWATAEFHEREVYDLFGIKFNNHPDLRRLFLDDDWKGYPLRKDYVDEINIVEL